MDITLAFYKDNSHLFNRLASWWTRGPYSHVELILSIDKKTMIGESFSSSYRDGGARIKTIDFIDPKKWDLVEIVVPIGGQEIRSNIEKLIGMKYDVAGLFGFFIGPILREDTGKVFCSESVLTVIGCGFEAWRFDPNTFYALTQTQG
jgi:hypothetical protein